MFDEPREELVRSLEKLASEGTGAERAWAYRNAVLLSGGFYSTDELIDMAVSVGFTVVDPFIQIKRGTRIGTGTVFSGAAAILGSGVTIGSDCVVSAALRGNNLEVGHANKLLAEIDIDNVVLGSGNIVSGLRGKNPGGLVIGDGNSVTTVSVTNYSSAPIVIGNNNELCAGLSINVPFPGGRIVIGHQNSLGRDGGGVVSSSYRFGRKWNGTTLIGSFVETTRGAEILGYSIIGWPSGVLGNCVGGGEDRVVELLVNGSLADLSAGLIEPLVSLGAGASTARNSNEMISLFGTVKTKRCVLAGKVTLKDDTRTQNAYVRDALIPERSKIYYSSIIGSSERIITVSTPDRAFDRAVVRDSEVWANLPTVTRSDEYPVSDADFYQDRSWDISEGKKEL